MQYMLPLLNMQAPPQSKSSKPQHMMRTVSISLLVMSLPVLYVSFLHVPPASLFRDTTFWFLMSNSIIIVIAADSGMLFFGSSSVDNDGLPFVVSGGEPAAVKDDGLVATGVSISDEALLLPVENHPVMVLREQQDATMVAESDHAYALVLREGRRVASEPESRDGIMAVAPPSSDLAVSIGNETGVTVGANGTASRGLARREERLRRRHRHRPSHSRALVPVQDKGVVVTEERHLDRTATDGRRSMEEEKDFSEYSRLSDEEEEDFSEYSRLSDEELNQRVEEFITKFNREIRLQLEREQQLALAAV